MNLSDYNHAMFDGPSTIMGSYLLVQPWTPDFDVANLDVGQTVVWIRFPSVPLHEEGYRGYWCSSWDGGEG